MSVSNETNTDIETQQKKSTRRESKERLAFLKTLQNPMLFNDTCAFLQRLYGDAFDAEMLDITLEPIEALRTSTRQHPHIVIYGINSRQWREDYRYYLAELGLTNSKQQDLVIRRMESDEPYTNA